MSPRSIVAALVSLALVPALAGAQVESRPRLEIEARAWAAAPSGEIQAIEQSLGTIVDLESDLGLGEDETIEGRLILRPSGRTKVYFAWTRLEFSGDQVLTRTIEFSGQTFTPSTRVLSLVDLEYGRAGFAWQLFSSDDGRWRLGPLVEVKAFRGEASLAAPDVPLSFDATEEFEAAVGAAGAVLDLEPSPRFHVFAEATVVVGADEGDATDIEAGVRFLLTDTLALVGGYRRFSVDAKEDDDTFQFDIAGAFAGLQFRF
jgi:hypothetical protein